MHLTDVGDLSEGDKLQVGTRVQRDQLDPCGEKRGLKGEDWD